MDIMEIRLKRYTRVFVVIIKSNVFNALNQEDRKRII